MPRPEWLTETRLNRWAASLTNIVEAHRRVTVLKTAAEHSRRHEARAALYALNVAAAPSPQEVESVWNYDITGDGKCTMCETGIEFEDSVMLTCGHCLCHNCRNASKGGCKCGGDCHCTPNDTCGLRLQRGRVGVPHVQRV